MARLLRIEYPGAFYHVTNRGRQQEAICDDDKDPERFLSCIERVSSLFGVRLHAYCLMTNHYPLVVETPEAIYLARELSGHSGEELGQEFGKISGAAISAPCKHIDETLTANRKLKCDVREIRVAISNS